VEVLVSDNASTDQTQEILSKFEDPRLRVIRQQVNIGSTANWNVWLAEAKGDYIVFVPDDDRIFPWLVERCVSLVKKEPRIHIVMAVGNGYLVAEDRWLAAISSPNLGTGVWDGLDILREYLEGRISVEGCTTMLRTEVLRACGGFPPDWPFAGDLVRHLSLLFTGRAGLVNECCGTYCVHSATATSNHTLQAHLEDLCKLVDTMVYMAEQNIPDSGMRCEIQRLAKRFLAFHALGVIASHRRRGVKLVQVLPLMWQWRHSLARIGFGKVLGLVRPLAVLILPLPITRRLRQLKRIAGYWMVRGRAASRAVWL
jgi:glycosyltransferase involved in cell wall biosynthesis